MRKVRRYLSHSIQCGVERASKGVATQRVTDFEEICEDLAVVGRRALVMYAVCENLFRQLDLQKLGAGRAPTRRFVAGEVRCSPDQRLDVFDKMVATEIGLEVVFEKPQLAGKTRLRAPNET